MGPNGVSYPIGQILQFSYNIARKFIASGDADEYKGDYPPNKKMKTNFFKPKD